MTKEELRSKRRNEKNIKKYLRMKTGKKKYENMAEIMAEKNDIILKK